MNELIIQSNYIVLEEESYFIDIISENNWFHREKENNLAVSMKNIYNKYPVCDIRCPWGCTEFIYKTGTIPFIFSIISKFILFFYISNFLLKKVINRLQSKEVLLICSCSKKVSRLFFS